MKEESKVTQHEQAADVNVANPAELAAALGNNQPTEQQREVIVSPLEPLLVVAGAGSGKTATMADRVVWLVANGLARPEEILGVTFTRKAAGELAARLRSHLGKLRAAGLGTLAADDAGDLGMEPAVSTYHSFAHSLVAEHGMRLGLEPDAPLWGPAQCWQLATRVVDAYDGPHEDLGARSTLIDAVVNYAGQAAEHLVDPADTVDWLLDRAASVEALPIGATARATRPAPVLVKLRARAIVARLAADYDAAKRLRGVMDYGDLVAYAARLAQRPEVAAAYRARYKVVLLDEFQDTSHAQIELFGRLFADGAHAVTAVGDPNQSIYGFRGASAGQLAAFRDRFALALPEGGTRRAAHLELTTAWRNDVALLAGANLVSAPISGRDGQLELGLDEAHSPETRGLRRPDDAGNVGEAAQQGTAPDQAGESGEDGAGHTAPKAITLPKPSTLDVPELVPSPVAGAGRVVLSRFMTSQDEAQALADFLVREREAFRADSPTGAWPSAAVLTRKRATMEPIAQALRERGVPVEIVGLGGLLSTPEVQDVVATLRAVSDPARSDALMRLLAGARWRIGPADLMVLSDFAQFRARRRAAAARTLSIADFETPDGAKPEDRGHADGPELIEKPSLIEALENLPSQTWESSAGRHLGEAAHRRLTQLRDELRRLRLLVGEELPLLVAEIVRTLGLDVELAAKPGADEHAARRHLDAFADVVAQFDGGDDAPDVGTFLDWLEAAAEKEGGLSTVPEPATDGTVQLLTVHASKGLEWDIVAVPAMNRGTFPSSQVTRWTNGSSELPWPFRGDRAELPQFTALDDPAALVDHQGQLTGLEEGTKATKTAEAEEGYRHEVARHAEREERRLAYVALTRGRSLLWCSSSRFSGIAKEAVEASPFFTDLLPLLEQDAPAALGGQPLAHKGFWVDEDAAPEKNPLAGLVVRGEWPYDPLEGPTLTRGESAPERPAFSRRPAMEAAAADVSELREQLRSGAGIPEPVTEEGVAWDHEARQLLLERDDAAKPVRLEPPKHVRASLFVEAADDREAVELDLRRPVPHRPGVAARQGTVFHAWVEEHYGKIGMFDLDDEEFFADVAAVDGPVLDGLREKFLASEWASKVPAQVEAPVETRIGPVSVRGRIDAVFRTEDGRWDLVDWKTGRVPSAAELPTKALQLAVYRLGWSRLHGVPLEEIDAAFYYVADGRTVRPEHLSDEAQLEALIRELFEDDAEAHESRGE